MSLTVPLSDSQPQEQGSCDSSLLSDMGALTSTVGPVQQRCAFIRHSGWCARAPLVDWDDMGYTYYYIL